MSGILSANVTIMVSDLDRAIQFYTDVLGFELKQRFGEHWADISAPGISIGLHPTREPLSPGTNMQIGLRVSDLKTAKQALEEKGVVFASLPDDQVLLAAFHDPDGNMLYLIEFGG